MKSLKLDLKIWSLAFKFVEIKLAIAYFGRERKSMDNNILYWSNILDGVRETNGFMPDNKRISIKDAVFDEIKIELSEFVAGEAIRISQNKLPNLFILLTSAASAVLAKYCFAKSVIIGIPVLESQKHNGLKNKFVLFKSVIEGNESFSSLVTKNGVFYKDALKYQNVSEEVLVGELELLCSDDKPLFKTMMAMKGIHDLEVIKEYHSDISIVFEAINNKISVSFIFNSNIYEDATIRKIGEHIVKMIEKAVENTGSHINTIDVLSEEEHFLLDNFQGKSFPLKDNENFITRFKEQVDRYGDKIALVNDGEKISYKELDKASDQIAGFIQNYCPESKYVGIYMRNCINNIVSIIGVQKAGAAYVPIDYDLPFERIKNITNDINLPLIISLSEHISNLNKLQVECESLKNFICLDTDDIYQTEKDEDNDLASRNLWEFVGDRSSDCIEGGGWQSSYTGENLSEQEMNEYGENVLKKLKPYLSSEKRVLEIGCASGITMFRVAPLVKLYYGTDLAQAILNKDKNRIDEDNITNIRLNQVSAIDIDTIDEQDFDIVIINSVIQCFNGYNYFREVLRKVIDKVSDKAIIFIGDVMDSDKKELLIDSLKNFAAENVGKGYTTKTDWSQELFFSKDFFYDLRADNTCINKVVFSEKIGTIRNELTDFRYDAMLFIDKASTNCVKKIRNQYGRSILNGCENIYKEINIHENDPAYVIYTSGTTGKPKGIEILHGALMRFCNWNNKFYELTDNDVSTRYARVGFDASVWELFPMLCVGGEIHIIPESIRLDIEKLNEYFEKHNVTFSFLPTQICEQFMKIDNKSLRVLATGGDKLHENKHPRYRLVNNYGPTETTIVCTAFEVKSDYSNIPIGKPIDNTRIHVVDRNGLPQPVGVIGELCIAGDNLASKYVNLPELTKEKFCRDNACDEERLYKSGDLARWLPDGNLEYFGRCDGQIKISAFRIEIEEIQNTLCEISGISQAVVKALSDDDRAQYLCAYVSTANNSVGVDEIKKYLSTKLPEYMIPSHIIIMERFPITANGKIDYAKLPKPDTAKKILDIVEPENEVEAAVLRVFKKILNTTNIGVTDVFFENGGNSIKAIKLVSELTQSFEVTINDIFTYQTVRELSKHIRSKDNNLDQKFEKVKEAIMLISGADVKDVFRNKYNKYISEISNSEHLYTSRKKYKSILLLGSTGFLGIHLLERLMVGTDSDLTVVIRAKNANEAKERLRHKWKHHFNKDISESYEKRLTVYAGDLEKNKFGLDEKCYIHLATSIDCVINAAANVSHYGYHEDFANINAELINRIISFANEVRLKEIHHVSTIGVAEGIIPNNDFYLFTENDSDEGQIVTNYYTETKLKAEQYISDARKDGAHINIYRVGNLIANSENGIFQENIGTNGFYKILRSMLYMKAVPNTNVRVLDFSYINQVSDAMVRIINSNTPINQNYHIYNPNNISMQDLMNMMSKVGFDAELLDADEFLDFLQNNYESDELGDYVSEFILHTRLFSIPDETHFELVCDKTVDVLKRLGFEWQKPNEMILKRMLDYCVKIRFFDIERMCAYGNAG